MATTNKRLAEGIAGSTYSAVYTASSTGSNYTLIKSVILGNTTSSDRAIYLKFHNTEIIGGHTISANDTIVLPFADSVIQASEQIALYSDVSGSVTYYISGVEVEV